MAKILIVDDEPDLLLIVQETLRLAGHDPITCSNPQMAQELLDKGSFDAAILDVQMPGMTGFELVESLRQDPRTASLPILLLSAQTRSEDRVRGLRLGANDYLGKPFDPDELLLRIAKLCGHQAEGPQPGLSGDLASYSCADLLQSLAQSSQSGTLNFQVDRQPAWIELRTGRVVDATYGSLRGSEACYGLLSLHAGRFRFREHPVASDEESTSTTTLLLYFHWMEDELQRRRVRLPQPHQVLQRVAAGSLQDLPPNFHALPLEPVLQEIEASGPTLEELRDKATHAPLSVELAVAMLVESGVVTVEDDPSAEGGRQQQSSLGALDLGLHKLVRAAARQQPTDRARVLLAAAGDRWEDFVRLIEDTPAEVRSSDWDRFRQRLDLRRGGSCRLRAPESEVMLHVLELGPETVGQAEWLLPACNGAIVWVGQGDDALFRQLTVALEGSWRNTTGLLVVEDPDRRQALESRQLPWRLLSRAPRDLGTALGLLQ